MWLLVHPPLKSTLRVHVSSPSEPKLAVLDAPSISDVRAGSLTMGSKSVDSKLIGNGYDAF